jgi:hypothetical protein
MTFLCRNVPGLPTAFYTILSYFNEFPYFHEIFTFEFPTRFCFTRLGVPLASNPSLLSFCTQYANDFASSANPVLIPVSLLFNGHGEGVEGGGGVKCERVETMFNQEFTLIGPRPNLILFNPLNCYKKSIHAAGDHHWSRQNIRLVRTETYIQIGSLSLIKLDVLIS